MPFRKALLNRTIAVMSDQGVSQTSDLTEGSGWLSDESLSWPTAETHHGVSQRRESLYEAIRRLEEAVARPSGLADWRIEIESALAYVEWALEAHASEVEAEDGLFAQVIEHAPQLIADIDSLKSEHSELLAACHTALSMAADWAPSTLRRRVNVLLGRLAIHRQYGAELLFDAYSTDIGGAG